MNQITLDFHAFIIHIWPRFGYATFVIKISGQAETLSIDKLCETLERVAASKR